MPSSRTSAVVSKPVSRQALLVEMLAGVVDPRDPRGPRHTVAALLAGAVCAVLTGARGFTAIAQWAKDAGAERLSTLGMRKVADESTFRRVFARLDADVLDQTLGAWAVTRARMVGGRRVLAIDGKAVRGARKRALPSPSSSRRSTTPRVSWLVRSASTTRARC